MMNNQEYYLICHCLQHMFSKPYVQQFAKEYGIKILTSENLSKTATRIADSGKVGLRDITDFSRKLWKAAPIEKHISNFQSSLLIGHNWHKGSPSILHRSLQDRVRECIEGQYSLQELLTFGADIMKQEYYIVAQHDILETSIIKSDSTIIPPIGTKSITDFIYKGVPVDLKVSDISGVWAQQEPYTSIFRKEYSQITDDEKLLIADELYKNADVLRTRKQAQETYNNWGLNRMYILVRDSNRWFSEPQKIISSVLEQLNHTKGAIKSTVHSLKYDFYLFIV